MNMTKKQLCDYYTHNFVKKGEIIEITNEHRWIQEMECSKCKITTYYPSDAFKENGELN